MTFCANCGNKIADGNMFCPNCGAKKIPEEGQSTSSTPSFTSSQPQQPSYGAQQPYQQPGGYQPQPMRRMQFDQRYYPSSTGDNLLLERCVAYFIDDMIASFLMCLCYVPGIIYAICKDGIRDGQSFGKGMMNLRVVRYNTGEPATLTDSCIRNCCNCCVCVALIEKDQRHVGDLIAGTVVIRDN